MRYASIAVGIALFIAASASGETIRLRNGTSMDGVVTNSDDVGLTLRIVRNGIDGTATFPRDQVDPHSWYRVRSVAVPDVAAERLALARYCLENGLFASAESELLRASSLDPTLETTVRELRGHVAEATATSLLHLAQSALDRGDLSESERLASIVLARFGTSTSAGAADDLLDDVLRRKSELEHQAAEDRKRTVETKVASNQEAKLTDVLAVLDAARRTNREALRLHQSSGSEQAFRMAIGQYERALKLLARLETDAAEGPPEWRTRVAETRRLGLQEAVGVHLNLGSLFLVRGSYSAALDHANEALALDPENRQALEFRARVELAATQSRRWHASRVRAR